MKKYAKRRIDVNLDELDRVLDGARQAPLSESDYAKVEDALHAMAAMLVRPRNTDLLCDHQQCMDARRGPANTVNQEVYRLTKKQFMSAAIQEGWWIDLEGCFCPAHAREFLHYAREAQERGKQAVVVAQGAQISAFGRSR